MIIAHYEHRLPSDYDIALIRRRAQQRGALWNDRPQLYFKAFLLRERGVAGATSSSYASLYLWQQDQAFHQFLVGGGYEAVIAQFGRAPIATRFALDARRGRGRSARFAYRCDVAIARDADLTATIAQEIAANADAAVQGGTVAAAVGIDPATWTLSRIRLTEETLPDDAGTSYQLLHLAAPLLATLP